MSPVRPTVTLIGIRDEPSHYELRDLLTRSAQPHNWLDADSERGQEALAATGLTVTDLPVVLDSGTVHRAATSQSLMTAWGAISSPRSENYDIAIVGAGPAGLAAAV